MHDTEEQVDPGLDLDTLVQNTNDTLDKAAALDEEHQITERTVEAAANWILEAKGKKAVQILQALMGRIPEGLIRYMVNADERSDFGKWFEANVPHLDGYKMPVIALGPILMVLVLLGVITVPETIRSDMRGLPGAQIAELLSKPIVQTALAELGFPELVPIITLGKRLQTGRDEMIAQIGARVAELERAKLALAIVKETEKVHQDVQAQVPGALNT